MPLMLAPSLPPLLSRVCQETAVADETRTGTGRVQWPTRHPLLEDLGYVELSQGQEEERAH